LIWRRIEVLENELSAPLWRNSKGALPGSIDQLGDKAQND